MNLYKDVWEIIISCVETNSDKFNILITCKDFLNYQCIFNQAVSIHKIRESKWFDKFTNVNIDDREYIPKNDQEFPLIVEKINIIFNCYDYSVSNKLISFQKPSSLQYHIPLSTKKISLVYSRPNRRYPTAKIIEISWNYDSVISILNMIPLSVNTLFFEIRFKNADLEKTYDLNIMRKSIKQSGLIIFRLQE